MTVEYKCTDVYKKPENPTEWLPCPRCGLRPLVWEFDNGRATACGCGTDCYSHWSVQAESIMSVIKRSDNGKSAAEELVSSCGLTEDECRKLQEESESFNDEMLEFIDMVFGHTDMIGEGEDDTE